MDAVLTGDDATRALQLYARLGATRARFDGNRVARAALTAAGRASVTADLARAVVRFVCDRVAQGRPRASTPRARRRPARGERAARASGDDRPRPRRAL